MLLPYIFIILSVFGFSTTIVQQSLLSQFDLSFQTIGDLCYLQKCSENKPRIVVLNIIGDLSPARENLGLGQFIIRGDCYVYTIFEKNLGNAYSSKELDILLDAISFKYRLSFFENVKISLVGHSRGATAILTLFSFRTPEGRLYSSVENIRRNNHLVISPYLVDYSTSNVQLIENIRNASTNLDLVAGSDGDPDCLAAMKIYANNNMNVRYISDETHFGIFNNSKTYNDFLFKLGLSIEK